MVIPNSRQHEIVCQHAELQATGRIQLRPAQERDIPGISDLLDRCPGIFPRSVEEIFQTLPSWLVAAERSQSLLTATTADSSELIGCVSFEAVTEKMLEIRSLAVSPKGAKENIGPLLVLEIERIAKERGFTEICARRVSKRQKEKLRFYRSVLLDDGSWCDYECTQLKVGVQPNRSKAGAILDIEIMSGKTQHPGSFEAIHNCLSNGGYRVHSGTASETLKPARVFLFRTYRASNRSGRNRSKQTRLMTQPLPRPARVAAPVRQGDG